MHQLIIVLISIVLTALMVTATAVYTPGSRATTDLAYQLGRDGFTSMEKAYRLYTSANNGAAPVATGTGDGGLSTNFGEFLPFMPAAPQGYQWTYGYSSSQSMNYLCLYSTNTAAAGNGVLAAYTRLQKVFPSAQYYITAGGAANCGSTTRVDTSTNPTDVALTYFVKNVEVFSPKAIPGLVLWLDADDPGSISLSGSTVTQWLDKSGYGNNAVQSTSAYMPAYSSAGFRGRGGLTFTRSLYSYMEVALTASLTTASVDTFVAGNITSNGAQSTLLSSNTAATCSSPCYTYTLRQADQGSTYPVDSGIQFSVVNGATVTNVEPTTATSALNVPAVWEGLYSAGSASVLQNGVGASVGAAMATPAYNLQIGRGPSAVQGQYLDGTLGEVIVYNRSLTSAERLRLQHYLGHKWSLASLTN